MTLEKTSNFLCNFCHKGFRTNSQLSNHVDKMHADQMRGFFEFVSTNDIENNENNAKNEDDIKQNDTSNNEKTPNTKPLIVPLKNIMGNDQKMRYKEFLLPGNVCKLCDKTFKTNEEALLHVGKIHLASMENASTPNAKKRGRPSLNKTPVPARQSPRSKTPLTKTPVQRPALTKNSLAKTPLGQRPSLSKPALTKPALNKTPKGIQRSVSSTTPSRAVELKPQLNKLLRNSPVPGLTITKNPKAAKDMISNLKNLKAIQISKVGGKPSPKRMKIDAKSNNSKKINQLFTCPIETCSQSFKAMKDAQAHLEQYHHLAISDRQKLNLNILISFV